MKTPTLVSWFLAAGLLLAATGCTSANSSGVAHRNGPVRLQVAVVVPASMNMIRDDDVADSFGQSVRATLHAHGFKGRIKLLDETDATNPDLPLLEVNLTQWQVDPSGNVSCTFGATLRTPAGEKGLGLFTGNALLVWAPRNSNARIDSFEGAAHDALDNLADRIEQTGLLAKAPAM